MRPWRATAVWIALGLGCAPLSSEAATPAPRPDVVVYLIDTLRADHLGTYGYERDTSPTLDRFASEGVVFENAYAQSSWTKASVGSLFTGLLPSRHGAVRRDQRLRDEATTIAEHLRAAGYRTAAFVSNPNVLPVFGFGQGFDDVFDVDSVMRKGTADRVHTAVYEYLDTAAPTTDPERAPLFLYVHTRDPHAPYQPPAEFAQRFPAAVEGDPLQRVLSLYDGEIAFADEEIGHFFDRLKRHGLYDDALIVVLSDHGEEFGDHGSSGHGRTLFEEQLRVPLIVRLPGGRGAGTRIESPVRIVDLLPTVSDLLGIGTPEGLDGSSFEGRLRPASSAAYDPVLVSELDLDGRAVRGLYRPPFKLILQTLPEAEAGVWLYDLSSDARERRNLAGSNASVVDTLRDEIARLDAASNGGTHVALSNAAPIRATHTVRGALRAVGGTFVDVHTGALEDGDVVRVVPPGDAIEVDVTLRNEPNPIGQDPAVIVDVDDMRFSLDPPTTRLRVDLTVDGVALAAQDLLVGASGPLSTSADPPGNAAPPDGFELSPTGPEALLGSPALAQAVEHPRPSVRIFTVPTLPTTTAVVDPALDARLRALGYLGPDSTD